MQPIVSSFAQTYKSIPSQHRPMLGVLLSATLIAALWRPLSDESFSLPLPIATNSSDIITVQSVTTSAFELQEAINAAESVDLPTPGDDIPVDEIDMKVTNESTNNKYVVSSGDTFIGILTQFGIDNADISLLTRQHKRLANLKIGQQLSWAVDANGNLNSLTWNVSQREARIYDRIDDRFSERVEKLAGEWSDKIIAGTINGSFVASAREVGLTTNEINDVIKALQWQLDFKRLQQNDRFTVLLSREALDGARGDSILLGVRLKTSNRDYYAIRAQDGRYYDRDAASLARSFLRLPLLKQARVSSPFNPRRLHPVTKKISPHNGVDFAVMTNTPVIATSDGEVVTAKYSGAAGNYIAIRHGRQYVTRYMHLNKILVKPGQKVRRGDRIGLSGNTGRSTGAHLHYELLVNNKPVNPLTANLPRAEGLTGKERTAFLDLVKKIVPQLQFN